MSDGLKIKFPEEIYVVNPTVIDVVRRFETLTGDDTPISDVMKSWWYDASKFLEDLPEMKGDVECTIYFKIPFPETKLK